MSKKQKPTKKGAAAKTSRPKTTANVFEGRPETVRRLAEELRELVLRTLAGATEMACGGAKVRLTLFSLGGKTICGVQPNAEGCLFYLHHIVAEDSSTLRIEGKGKHARHIKIEALDGAMGKEICRLLLLARDRVE